MSSNAASLAADGSGDMVDDINSSSSNCNLLTYVIAIIRIIH